MIKHVFGALLSIMIAELAGILGSLATVPNIPTWYAGLAKPFFTPPSWIFGPVWTLLYAAMGVSAYLLWMHRERPYARKALVVYGVQLVFNLAWSLVFFGLQQLIGGAVVILLLLGLIVYLTVLAFRVQKTAGWLLVPYLAWVSFATLLNISLAILN
ncbi:TspO protein [Candidatus Gracilibacteria bacterium CG17_big_fil_post_rev_8_21_14_2_50_48_13]|nr:MAG: TspO protein [Candidatus Gracilibacteria bacterium CG17_big_fil_post_rev_8_21_14_2_50_48_13]